MRALRRWRRVEFARIAWRDLAQWAELDETMAEPFARGGRGIATGRAVRAALARCAATASRAPPRRAEQRLIIVAMGKLGGGELNFSSDIDLVPVYTESGETDGARSISNQEFFTRLVQQLIRLLEQQTEDGFVFRIDLRLRPFGDSGPVVTNAAALEDYLQIHGRDWERYAWVKARAMTNAPAYQELFADADPPVRLSALSRFRRVRIAARDEGLIEREVQRRDLEDDIKLGRWRHSRDRIHRAVVPADSRRPGAAPAGHIAAPGTAAAGRRRSCCPRARWPNSMRPTCSCAGWRIGCRCAPTSRCTDCPPSAAERERLAWSMDCDDWSALDAALRAQRQRVSAHFRAVVFGDEDATESSLRRCRSTRMPPSRCAERLAALGWSAQGADGGGALLREFNEAAATRRLDKAGARRLAALLPVLATEAAATPEPLLDSAAAAARARGHRRALGLLCAAAAQRARARAPGAARHARRFSDRSDCRASAAAR